MKTIILGMALLLFAGAGVGKIQDYQPRMDKEGWQILFDGHDLDAWNTARLPGVWAINERGELFPAITDDAKKKGGYLFTKQRFCDYTLECDFKVAPHCQANSGVFQRVHNMNDPVNRGMEIQILDDGDYHIGWDAMNADGALYELVHPAVDANNPVGEWNHFRITLNANLVTVELNGKQIVQADLNRWTTAGRNPDGVHNKFHTAIGALPWEGFIGLQNHTGMFWFRNIRIKPLTDRKPQYTGDEPMEQVLRK